MTNEQVQLKSKIEATWPADLLAHKRWLPWFPIEKEGRPGEFAKVPRGSHSDPSTWFTFEEVWNRLESAHDGVGYNFLAVDGVEGGDISPFDLDHVRNPNTGALCNEAMVLLSRWGSFAEYSVSGRGIHVLTRGPVRGLQLTTTHLQFWNPKKAPRFFTVTGDLVGSAFSTIKDISSDGDYVFSTANHISAKCREELEKVDYEQWAALPPEPVRTKANDEGEKQQKKTRKLHPDFKLEEFLHHYNLPIDNIKENNLGKCYRLTTCPIKGEPHVGHNSTSTNFILSSDGGLGFECQSTGCKESTVHDAIRLLAEQHEPYPKPIYVVDKKKNEVDPTTWRDMFHTRTEALTLPENVAIVVRGLCNVGSISLWGALPKHGKSYLFLSIMKALLLGKKWLDYFEVSQSNRVIYLVPEVGLRGVMKRLRKLKMVDLLYDPITNPDGKLFIQTLSSKEKLSLDDLRLICAVDGADVFVDPLIRYIEGDENKSSDQRILSAKLLALISASARSVWCSHHAPKKFKDVNDITTQNVLRGTGEFAAFPDIIFGVMKTEDKKVRLYIKCTDARDDDEYLGDFEVELRPWIDGEGDMRLVVKPGQGEELWKQKRKKHGGHSIEQKEEKITFIRSLLVGSLGEKTAQMNEKFNSTHNKGTVSKWLKEDEEPESEVAVGSEFSPDKE